MKRKAFIQQLAAAAGAGLLVQACGSAAPSPIPGSVAGTGAMVGHLLRQPQQFGPPAAIIETTVAIAGSGISGLSAARWLRQQGQDDFLIFDLEERAGGNSAYHKTAAGPCPWGAHYITIPENSFSEYIDFLSSCGVITGFNKGVPVINEAFLCFEPHERLFINGAWQPGLIPARGVPRADQQEMTRFLKTMEDFKTAVGNDGRPAFVIPVAASSADAAFRSLDTITMKQWLQQQGYTSKALQWYVNYCCRDDFGSDYGTVSAWAGIHYFASRRGKAANASDKEVITWPQGNGWLTDVLQAPFQQQIRLNHLVLRAEKKDNGVEMLVYRTATKDTVLVKARAAILAVPAFAAARMLQWSNGLQQQIREQFTGHPWLVANIVLNRSGADLCWDNVVYGSPSLGYIHALHQVPDATRKQTVITYYYPLCGGDALTERRKLLEQSHAALCEQLMADMEPQHPGIRKSIQRIDMMKWGHGMICPTPGFLSNSLRHDFQQPIDKRILMAHTDLSGISIFEEAFYQGIRAARQTLALI